MTAWLSPRGIDGGLDAVPLPDGVMGHLWLCGKRVVGPDPESALRRANGANLIVTFNEAHELERDYPDFVDWLRVHDGARALWFPIPDLGAPPIEEAESIVGELVERLADGMSMILHCAGGIGRAPTIATLVLIQLGMDSEAAGAHIAHHRPMGGPEAGAQRELVEMFSARRAG